MLDLILHNLTLVGYAVVLLALSMVSNTCFGLWYNLKEKKDSFDKSKFFLTIVKFIMFALGLSALSILVTTIPVCLEYVGIIIDETILDTLDMTMILSMFAGTILKYTKDSIDKLKNILNGSEHNG